MLLNGSRLFFTKSDSDIGFQAVSNGPRNILRVAGTNSKVELYLLLHIQSNTPTGIHCCNTCSALNFGKRQKRCV